MNLTLENFTYADYQKLIDEVETKEELAIFAGESLPFPLTASVLEIYSNDKSKIVFKVIVDGLSVGHADIVFENPAIPRLCRIVVFKEFRGLGFGKMLTRELVKFCVRNLKSKIIELNVLEENKIAQKCYKKAGFCYNPANDKTFEINGNNYKTLSMIYFHSTIIKD